MRVSRIYFKDLEINKKANIIKINKDYEQFLYITKVLRLKKNYFIKLFDGSGNDFYSKIIEINKNNVILDILDIIKVDSESDIKINLAQCISKPNHFEITLQKSVELGVSDITPIISERSEATSYNQNKIERYKKIIISACEQSNRSIIPILHPAIGYNDFLKKVNNKNILKLIPTPSSNKKINIDLLFKTDNLNILIGPEGGFSEEELKIAEKHSYQEITLGPRILRTETAGIALISFLQLLRLNGQ